MKIHFKLLLLALIYTYLLSVWMPINYDLWSVYNNVNLFDGLKPRAIFGTLLELLPLEGLGKDYLGNLLRIISIVIWMYFINKQLYQSVFIRSGNKSIPNSLFIFFGISFIFAVSPITLLSLSVAGFIDAFPYAIVACIATSSYLLSGKQDPKKIFYITVLLVLATLSHEKSIFDISILLVWFLWKWGARKALWYFSPALICSILLLVLLGNKVASGETPLGYISILGNGFNFFWEQSFNIYGLIFGGGAFWFLYLVAATKFLKNLTPYRNKILGFVTVFLMLLISISTLLVAHDTNRMVALIWLPLILIIKEIDLSELFKGFKSCVFLIALCFFQVITPPMLIYRNGMTSFNCYGLWLSQYLPGELLRQKNNEQFNLFRQYRPDLTEAFINKCNDDKAVVTHIFDRFSKDDLKSLLVIHDFNMTQKISSLLPRDLTIQLKEIDINHSTINVNQLPEDIKYIVLLGSNKLPENMLNQYFSILFKSKNIVAAEITSFRDHQDLVIDFTKYRWPYMTQQGLFSPPESWGAWSISDEVSLKFSITLPKQFDLVFDAKAFGPNVGKNFIVSLGRQEIPLKLSDTFSEHRLSISNPENLNEIKIMIPNPTSPKDLNLNNDHRKLGIALKALTIEW
jgi:hypothetical protein